MANKYTIGGSEIGTLLGLNPWQTPMDLYMKKLGLIEPPPPSEPMIWGTNAEIAVARRYAKESGAILLPSVDEGYDRLAPMIHPSYPWWTGTPDRLIEPDGVLEIKIVSERSGANWGDAPDGEVPDAYLLQCQYYLGLTDRKFAHLAVQIGNRDFRVYTIFRDDEMLESIRVAAEAFINDHLIPETPPPLDSSESSKKYLNHAYPKDEGGILPAPPEAEHWAEQLALANKEIARWESVKALNENLLKGVIGNAKGIQSGRWKATWTKNRDSQKVDWERAFYEIGAEHDPSIVEAVKSKRLSDDHLQILPHTPCTTSDRHLCLAGVPEEATPGERQASPGETES